MSNNITKLDEVYCQVLKVSGQDKIEQAVDVTTKSISTGPGVVALAKAAGGAGVCNVTINIKDMDSTVITGVQNLLVWLSDDSTGVSEASTMVLDSLAPSTGTLLKSLTANATLICQTDASGVLIVALTDAVVGASSVGYVCVAHPQTGLVYTLQIETGDYGS